MTDFKPEEIERLLERGFVKTPPTFSQNVMAAVNSQAGVQVDEPRPNAVARPNILRIIFQTAALGFAGVIGISQALAFVFSLWITSVAG